MRRREFIKHGLAGGASLYVLGSLPQAKAATPKVQTSSYRPAGFVEAIKGYESRFPTLNLALRNAKPMTRTHVKWVQKTGAARINNAQILRQPWGMSHTFMATSPDEMMKRETLKKRLEILQSVENVLLWGEPDGNEYYSHDEDGIFTYRRLMAGGAMHYLGRKPTKRDRFELHVLRDLTLLTNRQANDWDGRMDEFICEISLVAG